MLDEYIACMIKMLLKFIICTRFTFRQIIIEVIEALGSDFCRGQVWRPLTSEGRQELSIRNHQSLTTFNLITHGFGCPAFLGMLNILQRLLCEAIRILDKDFFPPVSTGFDRGQHAVTLPATGNVVNPGRSVDDNPQSQQRKPYIPMHNFNDKGG